MKIRISVCIIKQYKAVCSYDRKWAFDFHPHQNDVKPQVSTNKKRREYRDWNLALIINILFYLAFIRVRFPFISTPCLRIFKLSSEVHLQLETSERRNVSASSCQRRCSPTWHPGSGTLLVRPCGSTTLRYRHTPGIHL